MKMIFTLGVFFIVQACSAQKMLVPYRSGKMFGLSDDNGRMIITPQFDRVQWLQGDWFSTAKDVEIKDTLEVSPGRTVIRNNGKGNLTGLVHSTAVILKDEPFEYYEIIANKCIVATYERRVNSLTKEQFKKYGDLGKCYCLFNLQGKNLYPANFRRIEKIDTAGISSRDKKSGRYILFTAVHTDDKRSLFVFDADRQEISDWLIKDAVRLSADRHRESDKQIQLTIINERHVESRPILDYSSGKFLLRAAPPSTKREEQEEKVLSPMNISDYDAVVEVPVIPGSDRYNKPVKFTPYHIMIRDTLYYLTSYEDRQHPIILPPGGKVILTEPRGVTQYQPVIVKSNNHFYIVKEDKPGAIAYDSLIYFGSNFLAWKTINGQMRAGVINAGDSAIVPFEYDSVYANIRSFNLENNNPGVTTHNYHPVLREADSKYSSSTTYPYKRQQSNFITVFKNGKCGVVDVSGNIILPVEYELIGKNNLQHSKPREDDFILLKQHGRYGMGLLQYNREKKRTDIIIAAAPAFEYIPGFFYPDYYGIKDYLLIGLYDEQYKFKGFVSDKGKVFYKD